MATRSLGILQPWGPSKLTCIRVTFRSFFALVCFVSLPAFSKPGFRCAAASGPVKPTGFGQALSAWASHQPLRLQQDLRPAAPPPTCLHRPHAEAFRSRFGFIPVSSSVKTSMPPLLHQTPGEGSEGHRTSPSLLLGTEAGEQSWGCRGPDQKRSSWQNWKGFFPLIIVIMHAYCIKMRK